MSYIKSTQDIQAIAEGGKLMGEILSALARMVKPGVSAWDIDRAAEEMIREAGGRPAFLLYQPHGMSVPFPATICASRNEEVVHGIPSKEKILHDGDVFTIDIGMEYPWKKKGDRGCYTDTALTVPVGTISKEAEDLLRVTREALAVGIRVCKQGNTIADIGRAIEQYVRSQGSYGIVRDLSGHGVGHAVHEDPWIPNFYVRELTSWKLEPGAVIAIEPMITLGRSEVKTLSDEWTVATRDGRLSAHFEHTIIITDGDPVVATQRPHEVI